MSLLKTNAAQIGQSLTPTDNFTLYQPDTPDGTVRLGNGNAGSVTDRITLTSAGNIAVGGTPYAWANGFKAIQIMGSSIAANGYNNINIATNVNGAGIDAGGDGGTYATTNPAARYKQILGTHRWYNAPSGTAGSAITFTQAMTLDASGQLTVGGTNALATVTATKTSSGAATTPLVVLNEANGVADTEARLFFSTTGNISRGTYISGINRSAGANNAHDMVFATSAGSSVPTERMRIDSAGGVSFGQRVPYSNAYTPSYGYLQTYGFALQCTAGYNVMNLTTNGYVNQSGQTVSYGAATGAQYTQTSGRHQFYTFNATAADQVQTVSELVRIDSTGYVRLQAAANGIQFNGDTAAANALNDYEEGTFTPVLRGTTSGTLNMTGGYYTKIGREVFVYIIHGNAIAANTLVGNLYITGLPFNAGLNTSGGYPLQAGTGLLHIRAAGTTGTAGAPFAVVYNNQVNLHTSANMGTTTVTGSAAATFPATGITQNGTSTVQIAWSFHYLV